MHECTDSQVEKDACEVAQQIANLKVDVDNLVETGQNVKLFMKIKCSNDEVNRLSSAIKGTAHSV